MPASPNTPQHADPRLTASPSWRRAILTAAGWAFAIVGGSLLAMLALYSAMRGVG